jgi:thiol-disulfide isomerase/thioredoxin
LQNLERDVVGKLITLVNSVVKSSKEILKIITLGLLVFASFLTFSPPGVAQEKKVAPPLRLKDLDGRMVRLSDYRGKVVLINFWATWCPPCRAEMPDLIKLQREYGKDGLQIIGITYPPEQKTRVRRFATSLKVNYPIVLGTRQTKELFSSDETLPLTVVIDRNGKVNEIISGILLREEFDEKIKPLLTKNTEGEKSNAGSNYQACGQWCIGSNARCDYSGGLYQDRHD